MLFVRQFDLCVFWICRFPVPLGVWEGLRFVIVALPGFFSYLFLAYAELKCVNIMDGFLLTKYCFTVRY